MQKTLRNKILKNTSKLVIADFNGEEWSCPDGAFGIHYNIYEGYRVKKDQRSWECYPKADLNAILENVHFNNDIIVKQPKDRSEFSEDGEYNTVDISLKNDSENITRMQVKIYDFIMDIYPKAVIAKRDAHYLAPVGMEVDGVLVAVISPLNYR